VLALLYLLIVLDVLDHRFFAGVSGFLSVSVAEAVSYALTGALFLYVCVLEPSHRRELVRAVRSSNVFVWWYFVWACLTAGINVIALGNMDALHSLKDALPGVFLYIALAVLVTDRRRLRGVHRMVLMGLALASLLGVSQYLMGGPYPTEINPLAYLNTGIPGAATVRHPVVGTLGHPNVLAELIAPLFVLSLGYWAEQRNGGRRIESVVWLPALALVAVALFLTQAKASIGWTVVTGTLALWLIRHRIGYSGRRSAALLLALSGAAVVAVLLLVAFVAHVADSLGTSTLVTRLIINYAGLQSALASPAVMLFGGGLKLFGESAVGSTLKLGIHGEYLSQLLRFGLPAVVLFSGILLRAVTESRSGWVYSLPLITLALIYVLESADGSQLQSLPLLLCGLADASALVSQRETSAFQMIQDTAPTGPG
jgi:hypothetical protein